MKESYKKPVVDVNVFSTVNVVTTSSEPVEETTIGDKPIVTPPDWSE